MKKNLLLTVITALSFIANVQAEVTTQPYYEVTTQPYASYNKPYMSEVIAQPYASYDKPMIRYESPPFYADAEMSTMPVPGGADEVTTMREGIIY